MLSEHDRRELALIEERLRSDDRRFADTFQTARPGWRRDRRWARRALLGLGAFMLIVGLAAGAAELVLQGLLVVGAGIVWTLLRRRTAAAERRPAARPQPGDRPSWDVSPPEWYRPI
jgi:Flp pilus assembly protein TadB